MIIPRRCQNRIGLVKGGILDLLAVGEREVRVGTAELRRKRKRRKRRRKIRRELRGILWKNKLKN